MKNKLLILLMCFIVTSCGLKRPLQDPDTYYPPEENVGADEVGGE